jgi:hypothetical protein
MREVIREGKRKRQASGFDKGLGLNLTLRRDFKGVLGREWLEAEHDSGFYQR